MTKSNDDCKVTLCSSSTSNPYPNTECAAERIYNKSTKREEEEEKIALKILIATNKLDVTLPTSTNSKELKIQILLGFKWIIHLYFLRTFGIVNFAFFNFQLYNHLKLEHRKQIRNEMKHSISAHFLKISAYSN